VKPPADLRVDDDVFAMRCIDDGDGMAPYVDVRFDTIPPCDGDPDYSENPDILRRAAAWLVKAADWLEKRQGR
jgi:hypothetical protein